MKGLKKCANGSAYGVRLYYDIETQTANLDGKGYFVTVLIRKNTEKEIKEAIERLFLNM